MENKVSVKFSNKTFRKWFLLKFTKELIMNSASAPVYKLQNILEKEEEDKKTNTPIKKKVEEVIKAKEMEVSILSKRKDALKESLKEIPQPVLRKKTFPFQAHENAKLTIPDVNLPERFSYLRPVPKQREFDLKKLTPLIKDSFVKIIECNGADENIIVKGKMGEKKTPIVLNNKEIDEIIDIFSKETKIPVQEGIYKVVLGNLVFLAIVSEVIGSKFIIRKLAMPPVARKTFHPK